MNKKILLTSILATSVLLAGCSDDDDDSPAAQYSYVRVLHASADAPNVDVLVDGQVALADVAYQQGSGYLRLSAGNHEVALRVSDSSTIALSANVTLAADAYYSVIAQNDVADLELQVLDDTTRVNNGSTDVTVVHAATEAGNVDVYVTAANAELPDDATLGNVPFDANATLPNIASGSYQVRLTGAGSSDVVYDSGTLGIAGDLYAVAVNSTRGAV